MRPRAQVLVLLGLAGVVAAASLAVVTTSGQGAPPAVVLAVDEHGGAVPGAVAKAVEEGSAAAEAGADGRLALGLDAPALVTVTAEGRLPRVVAAAPGQVSHAVLTGQADSTVSVRVGGDVMFGRRYFDADEDGSPDDSLLTPMSDAAAHAALLEHVAPLLADADITVVNLETPLVSEPYLNPTAPRPERWHSTKEFVFASSPASVDALLDSGVDAVSLGNNHVLDALDDGLAETIDALNAAGMPYFGAGLTEDDAWRPAVVERKGQRVAMLGCTTVTGREHAISYVAEAGHGGAAACTEERLWSAVTTAREVADVVLVMIHGGKEYRAQQVGIVREMSDAARQAGAALVVNGHPHVVGSAAVAPAGDLVVDTTGNLLFDQDAWPTLLSYLVRADVQDGEVVAAVVDPFQIEDYVTRPVVGAIADASARKAAGLSQSGSGMLLGQGAMTPPSWDLQPPRSLHLPAVEPVDLPAGWWLPEALPGLRVGEDLLWSGSFEDLDTDPSTPGAHHWFLSPKGARLTADARCSGDVGVELRRGGLSQADTVLTPDHRQLVGPGQDLSLLVDVRRAGGGGTVELRTYVDTRGGSSGVVTAIIPPTTGRDGCTTVRLDLRTPPGTAAVQPFVRLGPPGDVQGSATLAVDDVRLVAWSDEEGAAGPRWNHLEADETTSVDLVAVPKTPWP